MAIPVEIQKIHNILSRLLSEDNDTRKQTEGIYAETLCSEKFPLLVAACMTDSTPLEQAELAAVLLRRLLATEYDEIHLTVPVDVICQIKFQLLHRIQQNINRNLRKKLSDAAAELARKCMDDEGNNLWPEFLKFLFDSACSTDPVLREMSLLMFSVVPGVFGNQQNKYLEVIRQMLSQSLCDQEKEVKYAAGKATAAFLMAHEKQAFVLKQFSECINLLLQFCSSAMEDSEGRPEDILKHFNDLVETCPQIFRGHLDVLLQLCLKGISNPVYQESCCHLSLEVVVALSEAAPVMMRKLGSKHLPTLISLTFKMMTDLDDDPSWDFIDDENSDEDNDSNPIVGEAALDRLACALGGKTILPIVLNTLPRMLHSSNWKERYAGLMTISAVGEGCHKQMSSLLQQILDGVFPFLLDSHSRVRYAACNALGQMSSDFAPVFQKKFHGKAINALLPLMNDSTSPRVQAHASAALVNFLEECPKVILAPYIHTIVGSLASVLNSQLKELMENGKKLVLEQAVVTLASLADCAEEKFTNYYEKFMPYLKFIIQNANLPDLRILRGKTIECVSLIGLAVGKEKFLSDASEVMDLLLKAQSLSSPMADDDPQLSYMISAWARICRILGKAFEPYLPFVMQPVLKAASLKPEIAVLDTDDMKVVENDDDWEFVNIGEKCVELKHSPISRLLMKHNFGIRTAGLEEKATACQMLVCYARELKEGFAAYVEEAVKLMVPMLKFYFHDGVRIAAGEILPFLLESAKVRGEAYVTEMWRYILPPLLTALETEPDTEVLCEQMAALSQCIDVMSGPCLSHDELVFLFSILTKYLMLRFSRANAREQQRKEEDYDDILEETLIKLDDDDVYLLGKIADVLCTLIATYKQDIFSYFDEIVHHFAKLLEPNRPSSDRQWSLCVFADIIEHGGPACSRYQQYFLEPILSSLRDENPDLRQTAAYTIGILGQFGGPEFSKYCSDSLPLLIQLINTPDSRSDENSRSTENVIAAVTKFMEYNSLINMSELIPIWMTWLPIWEDDEETKYVFNFLCALLEANNSILLGKNNCNLPRIVQIIAEVFHREAIDVTSDLGIRILTLIRDIQSNAQLFSICVSHLNLQQQEALHAALTSQ